MIACALICSTTSCSKDDEDDGASPFSPPAWVQGTWVYTSDYDASYKNEVTVTSNNIIDVIYENNKVIETYDFLNEFKGAGSPQGAIKEQKSETKYVISSLEELDDPNSWYDDYIFEKTDKANEILINGDLYTKK